MRGISSKLTVSTYTQSQRAELERFYSDLSQEEDALSSLEEKFRIEELADKIDLTAEQVRMWLRNRKKRGVYKGRSALAVEQVRILEWIYENHSNYPSTNLKKRIAEELEISYSQLQKWYETRRQRGAPALISKFEIQDQSEWELSVKKLRELIHEEERNEIFVKKEDFRPHQSITSIFALQQPLKRSRCQSPTSTSATTTVSDLRSSGGQQQPLEPLLIRSSLKAIHASFVNSQQQNSPSSPQLHSQESSPIMSSSPAPLKRSRGSSETVLHITRQQKLQHQTQVQQPLSTPQPVISPPQSSCIQTESDPMPIFPPLLGQIPNDRQVVSAQTTHNDKNFCPPPRIMEPQPQQSFPATLIHRIDQPSLGGNFGRNLEPTSNELFPISFSSSPQHPQHRQNSFGIKSFSDNSSSSSPQCFPPNPGINQYESPPPLLPSITELYETRIPKQKSIPPIDKLRSEKERVFFSAAEPQQQPQQHHQQYEHLRHHQHQHQQNQYQQLQSHQQHQQIQHQQQQIQHQQQLQHQQQQQHGQTERPSNLPRGELLTPWRRVFDK